MYKIDATETRSPFNVPTPEARDMATIIIPNVY